MICNDCGALNENDAQFCIHCGGSLSKFQKLKILLHNPLSHKRGSFRILPFLHALFDLSFKQRVSLKVIKAIYILSILSAALAALICIIAGFYGPRFFGIFMLLIGAPLIFLLVVLYSRVLLEAVLFKFQTADPKPETEKQPDLTDEIKWNV
ncbi:MAG: DUF4282 domain-containing protein [Deltaproteobacteria bacterium]|nr:DUF4282 domain-containing protein [Deltaproteobacteria bacterium]MBM4347022.1 DUF4282 domain-containing protein [Deltaproteobacteria bacterium]